MKRQLILTIVALTLIGAFPACTTVEEPAPTTHTSTTTESRTVHPVQSSVESTTVHSY